MIHKIWASSESFKTVEFESGLNVVLADRSDESSDKESRNGLGKTTLLRIIHFCLGSDLGKDATLSNPALFGWSFYLKLDLRGGIFVVERNTSTPEIVVLRGDFRSWDIDDDLKVADVIEIAVTKWRSLLGWLFFDIAPQKYYSYTPKFRNLLSFFVRKGRNAFSDPFDHVGRQKAEIKQIHNAFLLQLDWENIWQWHSLKAKKDKSENIVNAIMDREGSQEQFDTLKSREISLEDESKNINSKINAFVVHPNYSRLEDELTDINRGIKSIVNTMQTNKELISYYNDSLEGDKLFTPEYVYMVYEEIQHNFSDMVKHTIEQAYNFHKEIYDNRGRFIEEEIERMGSSIEGLRSEMNELMSRKDDIVLILKSHGALSDYLVLQDEFREVTKELSEVRARLDEAHNYQKELDALEIEVKQGLLQLRNDLADREKHLNKIRKMFIKNSQYLYEEPGHLIIAIGKNALKLGYQLERPDSDGFQQMAVFCYDLMLSQLWSDYYVSPGFLIHDSPLFADVDPRQKAKSIELAQLVSEKYNFQYICCLNSDTIPYDDFTPEFDLKKYVRLVLSDEGPEGRLLGIKLPAKH